MATTRKVLGLLVDGIPRGIAEIARELGLGNRAVARAWGCLCGAVKLESMSILCYR